MQSRHLALALVAPLSLLAGPVRAAKDPSPTTVRVEGPSGAWLEEEDPDGSWRFVCDLPCDATVSRAADHRVSDGPDLHKLRLGNDSVVVYRRPGAPENVMIAGAVIGGVGATIALLGLGGAIVDGLSHMDLDPDSPPRETPKVFSTLVISGGITLLVGGVLALTGVIARDAATTVANGATPLGFRF